MGSAIGWVLWLLYTALLGVLYSRLPPNPDQQIFDYIGWVGLNGSRFYIDVVEQNLPGEMLLHELSTWLFGNQIWAYRVLDYALMVLVGCGALFALCRLAGRPRESYLVVPLYQAMYVSSGAWFAGQRDIGAAHFLLAVGAALIWRERGGRASWLVAIGLGIVGAVLIRPNYLVYTLPLVAHDLITARVRPRPWRSIVTDVLIVAGVIIAAAAAILVLAWKKGALAPWYDSVVQYNAYSYTPSFTAMSLQFFQWAKGWYWYAAFATIGGAVWWRRRIGRDVLGILLCLVVTSLISAYVRGKGFGYHLGAFLPVFAIPIAACLVSLFEAWRTRPTLPRFGLALAATLVLVLGLGKKIQRTLGGQIEWLLGRASAQAMLAKEDAGLDGTTMADVVAAAEFAQQTTSSDATVLTVPRPVAVNFLSRRRSPSRFITFGMLTTIDERLAISREWSAEFAQMMATTPPDLILTPGPGSGEDYDLFWKDPAPPTPIQVLRRELSTRYRFERRFGSMDLYRLSRRR